MTDLVGIFGGTFDPVHNAHLRVALDVAETGALDQVRLVPCHIPPHRAVPDVTAADRLEMLRLAAADEPRFRVDDRELRRDGPSYTVDTLRSMAAEHPEAHLCLLLGTDTFRGLDQWHRWRELAELAHFIVMERPDPGRAASATLTDWLRGRETDDWADLQRERAGRVLAVSVTQLGISATEIRHRLGAGRSGRYLLPDRVWDHVQSKGFYGAGGSGPDGERPTV